MPVSTRNTLLADRYRILEPLGSGGMAAVYLCEDERLGRKVAVKRLHSHTADDVARRFEREAKLGASLNHPGVVGVFDTVRDEEGALIVMEYVSGQTLADALKKGPLDPDRVAEIVGEVAAALDHAHANGVLHRDVKPANILLRDDGLVKLADLGIATGADHTRITLSGVVLGTASYMSPEQVEGEETGPASDVYSLAAVAYEALSGRKARAGNTPMEVARQIVERPPPDLSSDWPEAPPEAARVLRRAMVRDPEQRHDSAGEFATALKEALEAPAPRPAPTPAPAPTRALPPVQYAQRDRRRWIPVAALIAVLLLAAIAVAALGGGDPDEEQTANGGGQGAQREQRPEREAQQPAPAQQEEQPAPAEEEPAPAEEPAAGGDSGASGAELNAQGFDLMSAGRYDEAIPVLEEAVASFPEGTTDLNYAYALFNLGKSLRLAGRPDEAIPILEQRLDIPNQTETVRQELQAARRAASQS